MTCKDQTPYECGQVDALFAKKDERVYNPRLVENGVTHTNLSTDQIMEYLRGYVSKEKEYKK